MLCFDYVLICVGDMFLMCVANMCVAIRHRVCVTRYVLFTLCSLCVGIFGPFKYVNFLF